MEASTPASALTPTSTMLYRVKAQALPYVSAGAGAAPAGHSAQPPAPPGATVCPIGHGGKAAALPVAEGPPSSGPTQPAAPASSVP